MKEKEEELEKVPEDTAESEPETVKSETEETDAAEACAETEDAEESVRTEDPEEPAPEESPAEKAEPVMEKQSRKKSAGKPAAVPEKAEPEEVPEEEERRFTQKDVDRIVKKKLAQALPPKEEMEQYKKWRESQQTLEEKMSNLRVDNQRLREENENLLHENLVVKAGVDKDAVDFVLYKVSRMEGDFDENLEAYLKKNPKYVMQKTVVVEGAEHKQKAQLAITRKDLDAMGYQERAKFRTEHPEEYARAMGR